MNAPVRHPLVKSDLDSREQIAAFVECFYAGLLKDPVLAPIFLEVAAVDLEVHKPHIVDYWCKLLLGDMHYQRHTMNIHRKLHGKRALAAADFQRWLDHFERTVDTGWRGEKTERAKQLARAIAGNMNRSLAAGRA